MGAKQSATGSVVLSQSPTLENIREAYEQGEERKAHELIRIACQEIGGGRTDTVRWKPDQITLTAVDISIVL